MIYYASYASNYAMLCYAGDHFISVYDYNYAMHSND